MEKMTSEERSEVAKKGAAARWASKTVVKPQEEEAGRAEGWGEIVRSRVFAGDFTCRSNSQSGHLESWRLDSKALV
jgi:hypothetical protein